MMTSLTAPSVNPMKEEEIDWSGKPSEPKPRPPVTVGQAKLDVLTGSDPTYSAALYEWTRKLRTTEQDRTDRELAEAFVELTERIATENDQLRETPLTESGPPWLERWRKNQKRTGKRDAIGDELKARGRSRATMPPCVISSSQNGSAPLTSTVETVRDPFTGV